MMSSSSRASVLVLVLLAQACTMQVQARSPADHRVCLNGCAERDSVQPRIEAPVEEPCGVRDARGMLRQSGMFVDPRVPRYFAPMSPEPAFSTFTEGTVKEHLPDGFVIKDERGRAVVIETICPSEALGLRLGDKVFIFGGPGKRGGIASGAIERISPDSSRQPVPDGSRR